MNQHPPIPEEYRATQEELSAYQDRVVKYTVSLTVFKKLFRDHPDLFNEAEWQKIESLLAEKYELPDNSVFRQKELPEFDENESLG